MTLVGWLQIALLFGLALVTIKPLGLYMARLFEGERTFLSPVLRPVERSLYAIAGVRPDREQGWLAYVLSMLAFNLAGFLILYALLRLQGVLPFNPQGFGAVAPDLAFNTAVSFVTNTNWQAYGGETTMSHFSQMAGLTVQNFLSGRLRHGHGHRLHPRLCPWLCNHAREFLGRHDPRHALRAPAPRRKRGPCLHRHGPAADARRLRRRHHARRRAADAGNGAHRQPGSDQAARHQWRGFPERQCRASLRKPECLGKLREYPVDARHHDGAALHFRPDGGRPQAGLGFVATIHAVSRGRHGHHLSCRNGRQSGPCRARARSRARQHGRQGSPLRPGHDRRLCCGHHRDFQWWRQRHAWLVYRGLAGWFRCSSSSSRSAAGRRRLRPLRPAGLCHPLGLRRPA